MKNIIKKKNIKKQIKHILIAQKQYTKESVKYMNTKPYLKKNLN